MNCQEFIDQLLDLEEGTLEQNALRLCREHEALCHQCADYLKTYRATIELEQGAFALEAADVDSGAKGVDIDPPARAEVALPEETLRSILDAIRSAS